MTMQLVVQPNLAERVVFEVARRESVFRDAYERQFAACYDERDPARREQAFLALHERWFRELGRHDQLLRLVADFHHIQRQVARFMVVQAGNSAAQTVELFGAAGEYTVVMAVAAVTFLDVPAFDYWARHELLHVDDMLNPAFEYDRTHATQGRAVGTKRLALDRFAVLWAIAVDARLDQAGRSPVGMRERRAAELGRAFGVDDTAVAQRVCDTLWKKCQDELPTHPQLMSWADQGPPGLECNGRSPKTGRAGAPCPLCGFPTFDWWAESAGNADWIHAVHADFPAWSPKQGMCGRCAEVYRAVAASSRSVDCGAS